jgi:hypothetical protein
MATRPRLNWKPPRKSWLVRESLEMIIQRRSFLIGLASLLAAPAIVRAESIMPMRAVIIPLPDPLVPGHPLAIVADGNRTSVFPCGRFRGPESGKGVLKPLSHRLRHIEEYRPGGRKPIVLLSNPVWVHLY